MSRVTIESLLTGRREVIEVNLGRYSMLTFDIIERIGSIPEVYIV